MSQPPYPPQGGSEPGGDQPGRWHPPPDDEPTQQIHPSGQRPREQTQQFPHPGPYGPPGQPPPYGPPGPYAPPHYGQPGQYGAPGQAGRYGQYGQYAAPGQYRPPGEYGRHGQPWAPPGGPVGAPPTRNKNTLIALVVAGVVVLAAVGVALFLVFGNDNEPSTAATGTDRTTTSPAEDPSTTPERTTTRSEEPTTASEEPATASEEPTETPTAGGPIPNPTVTPEGLGDDPVFDALALACYLGDMSSCDTLYDDSDPGSDYQTYGDTCAGRQPSGTLVYCSETFPQ